MKKKEERGYDLRIVEPSFLRTRIVMDVDEKWM